MHLNDILLWKRLFKLHVFISDFDKNLLSPDQDHLDDITVTSRGLHSRQTFTDRTKRVSSVFFFFFCPSVPADADGSQRRRVVQSDVGRHGDQRLHRPDVARVGRRERRVRAHAVRTHVHRALHASPRQPVTHTHTHTDSYSHIH